jgi:hypothetical protein
LAASSFKDTLTLEPAYDGISRSKISICRGVSHPRHDALADDEAAN